MIKKMRRFAPVAGDIVAFCQGKTKWRTEKAAQRTLSELKAANPGAFDSTVRPYRCPSCKRWHFGHGS